MQRAKGQKNNHQYTPQIKLHLTNNLSRLIAY